MNRISHTILSIIFPFLLFTSFNGFAQSIEFSEGTPIEMRIGPSNGQSYIPPADWILEKMQTPSQSLVGGLPCATIDVYYHGFTPEAQAALQAAVDIWSTVLTTTVPIEIVAYWSPTSESSLGSINTYHTGGFPNAPSNNLYPLGLANQIAGENVIPAIPDMTLTFNSSYDNWYFGIDGQTPIDKADFVTIALKQIAHGLGFYSSVTVDETPAAYFSDPPMVYDTFLNVGIEGTPLLDLTAIPEVLYTFLFLDAIYCTAPTATAANGGVNPKIHAPLEYQQEVSIFNWDEIAFPAGTPNSLMTPEIGFGEAIHNPGDITIGLFEDLGWEICNTPPFENNAPCDATPISCGETITGSTQLATASTVGPGNCAFVPAADVFYQFEAQAGMLYTVDLVSNDIDAVITAYTGNCLDELNIITCANNGITEGEPETMSFTVESNSTVTIQVFGYAILGEFDITLSCALENDSPCYAIDLPTDGSLSVYTNVGATADDSEIAPPVGTGSNSCLSQDGWCANAITIENSIWFSFVAPPSGNITVSLCNDGTTIDTQLALYTASDCDDYTTYTLIGANDDLSGCVQLYASSVTACVIPGETYYIQADGYNGASGDIAINVTEESAGLCADCPELEAYFGEACDDGNPNTINDTVTPACECIGILPPPNDLPCNATSVNADGSITISSNMNAGASAGEVAPPVGTGSNSCVSQDGWCANAITIENSIWFSFVAPPSGNITVSSCNDGTTIDTQLALYTASDCDDYTTYTLIGANDDLSGCVQLYASSVTACVIPGETYYIQADGYNGASGDIAISVIEESAGLCADCPALSANIGDACDDGNSNTENDLVNADCECEGTITYDCPSISAYIGDACDDGDPNTQNESVTADCECIGLPICATPVISDYYIYTDDFNTPFTGCLNAGTPYLIAFNIAPSSGNTSFIYVINGTDSNEVEGDGLHGIGYFYPEYGTINIEFTGVQHPECNAVIEIVSPMCFDCPSLSANIGDACDDGDPNTQNDSITAECNCVGTTNFDCPLLSANIGDACDDGDPNTQNESVTADCECIGLPLCATPVISDFYIFTDDFNTPYTGCLNAGTPYLIAYNIAPSSGNSSFTYQINGAGSSETEGTGLQGIGYFYPEEGNIVIEFTGVQHPECNAVIEIVSPMCLDCPELEANIGDACDDGDPNTINETINTDCECVGAPICATPVISDYYIYTENLSTPFTGCLNPGELYSVAFNVAPSSGNTSFIVNKNGSFLTETEGPGLKGFGYSNPSNGTQIFEFIGVQNPECYAYIEIESPLCTYCPELEVNIGATCDDGDPNTINDIITYDCECVGITPAPNDLPCNATSVNTDGSILFASSVNAFADEGEVAPPVGTAGIACQSQDGWCTNANTIENSIWFSFVAPPSGNITVSTCNDGTTIDTQLALYTASDCDDYTTYTLIGANDDLSGCVQQYASSVTACVIPGETYYIQADGYNGESGDIAISVIEESAGLCADCPVLESYIGDACNDGNPDTENDTVTPTCDCVGTSIYDCPDLAGNIGDACDDGDPSTTDDEVQADCTCEGELVGDGTLNGTVDWDSNCASRNAVMHIYQAGTNSLVATHTFDVNPDGTFIIPIENFGTFDVYFKVDGFLRTVVTNHVSALGANPIDFGPITPGDINGDNGVNVADVSGLIASFNSVIGDANFNPLADLNCDGGVNIADASILNSSFNLTGVSLP